MPLLGVPSAIHPELLYALARMGHGDSLVLADAHFPADSLARGTAEGRPLRVRGSTAEVLAAVLRLFPLDQYEPSPLRVMRRVPADERRDLPVPAYEALARAAGVAPSSLAYVERFAFYEQARSAFVIVQTDDCTQYANAIVYKGVVDQS